MHRQDVFYTHPDIISDFRQYVSHLLNHVNPLNNIGIKVKYLIFNNNCRNI